MPGSPKDPLASSEGMVSSEALQLSLCGTPILPEKDKNMSQHQISCSLAPIESCVMMEREPTIITTRDKGYSKAKQKATKDRYGENRRNSP